MDFLPRNMKTSRCVDNKRPVSRLKYAAKAACVLRSCVERRPKIKPMNRFRSTFSPSQLLLFAWQRRRSHVQQFVIMKTNNLNWRTSFRFFFRAKENVLRRNYSAIKTGVLLAILQSSQSSRFCVTHIGISTAIHPSVIRDGI